MARTPTPGYAGMTKEQSDLHDQITEHERYILKFFVGVAAVGSVIGLLAGSLIPIHRNVTETTHKKVVVTTIKKTKVIPAPDAIELPADNCLQGKMGEVAWVTSERIVDPTDENSHTWRTYVKFHEGYTCMFLRVNGEAIWVRGDQLRLQGGIRI